MKRRIVFLLALAVGLAASAHAGAVRDFSGFTLGVLGANDDSSTPNVGLPFTINFFGQTQSIVNVNNNGNLTFGLGQAMGTYTPFGLTGPLGRSIVAPFFADVDTRNPASGLVTYGNVTVNESYCGASGCQAFVANYAGVGYYSSRADKTNSFQVLLVDRDDTGVDGDFDIEFNYDRIQWETGSASGGSNGFGGTSAAAGYSNGTGNPGTFYQAPGSLVNGALLDGGPNSLTAGSFNSTIAGRYVFQVRNGTPIDPGSIPTLPILPSIIVPAGPNTPPVFQFNAQPPARWFDPPIVYGYEYELLTPGIFFTEVRMPAGSSFSDLFISYGSTVIGPFDNSSDSQIYLFPDGSNVTSFRITGINPLLDPDDPDFPNAFPTYLDVDNAAGNYAGTMDFRMTPLADPAPVPEPATWTLLAASLAGFGFRRFYRK
jgi:hypothetical protein